MRKIHFLFIVSLLLLGFVIFQPSTSSNFSPLAIFKKPALQVPSIKSSNDQDHDGVDDFSDLVASARAQIGVVTKYDTSYYSEAFPPADRGACADVLWRAFNEVGYDFKKMIDQDIARRPNAYPENPIQDSNINFRRVQNIRIFLSAHAQKLTTEVIPGNVENLEQWQGGDIVTFEQIPGGLWHVAIISDTRKDDGVPLLIHNYGSGVKESDYLINWPTKISGHYRLMNNS